MQNYVLKKGCRSEKRQPQNLIHLLFFSKIIFCFIGISDLGKDYHNYDQKKNLRHQAYDGEEFGPWILCQSEIDDI